MPPPPLARGGVVGAVVRWEGWGFSIMAGAGLYELLKLTRSSRMEQAHDKARKRKEVGNVLHADAPRGLAGVSTIWIRCRVFGAAGTTHPLRNVLGFVVLVAIPLLVGVKLGLALVAEDALLMHPAARINCLLGTCNRARDAYRLSHSVLPSVVTEVPNTPILLRLFIQSCQTSFRAR